MRLANEQDQAIIRSAIADSSASSLSFLSSMGQREAIAFGDGVATTMRMKFEALPHSLLPGVKDKKLESIDGKPEEVDLAGIVNRLAHIRSPWKCGRRIRTERRRSLDERRQQHPQRRSTLQLFQPLDCPILSHEKARRSSRRAFSVQVI